MPALQAQDLHLIAFPLLLGPGHGNPAFHQKPPGAADEKYPFLVRIQVQKLPSPKHGKIYLFRAQQPNLLIYRQHHLQRRVRQRLIFQQCKGIGHGNAVIPSQRRPPSTQEIPFHIEFQPILRKVNLHAAFLLADHVEMPLDNHWLRPFVPFRGLFSQN